MTTGYFRSYLNTPYVCGICSIKIFTMCPALIPKSFSFNANIAFFCRTTKWMSMLWICKLTSTIRRIKENCACNFVSECVRALNNSMLRNWRFSSYFHLFCFPFRIPCVPRIYSNKCCQDGLECSIQFGMRIRRFYKKK